MAQPAEIYVDPSIAGDSGNGLIGSPYGDLEYAIEQTTFDTTNGTRVNIKAGTDEVVAVELSAAMADTGTSIAWVPAKAAPCIFQGYTSAAGDGGIGGISGGGSVSVYDDTAFDYVNFIDLHCHNTGSALILRVQRFCNILRCEADDTTGDGIIFNSTEASCLSNHVHNIGGDGITMDGGLCAFNYLENGANDFSNAIHGDSFQHLMVYRNIIKIDGASNGIRARNGKDIINNSIWSNGGTGKGMYIPFDNEVIQSAFNNLIEGFSGTGGVGFDFTVGVNQVVNVYGNNSSYDNTTHYKDPGGYVIYELGGSSSNETLSASPFTDAANGDFSPVDTGAVKEGSLPDNFAGQ